MILPISRIIVIALLATSQCAAQAGELPVPAGVAADPRSAEPSSAALHREIDRLNQRIDALEQRIEELLNGRDATIRETVVSVHPAATQAAPMPQEPTVELGGRIKADLIHNSRSLGGPGGTERADTALLPRSIPLTGRGEAHQLTSNARDSRFWINANTPAGHGDLTAYLELDFVSSDGSGNEKFSNSYNPRLRHAYGTFGGFTAGQTYTTFLNVYAYPELNDANGPIGIHNVRQPQLRYRHETSDRTRWSLAMEQPESTLQTGAGSSIAPDDDRWPDFVARFDQDRDWGNWSLAALIRQLRVDDGGSTDSAWTTAFSASGRIYISELDNVRFAASAGSGLGRYTSFNAFDDGMVTSGGAIRPIRLWSGFIALQHWWTSELRTNLALGLARANPGRAAPATMDESYSSMHLNLIWSPVPSATLGVEWLKAERSLTSGDGATLHRIQFTSLYKF